LSRVPAAVDSDENLRTVAETSIPSAFSITTANV
jgi:hypothetical protein